MSLQNQKGSVTKKKYALKKKKKKGFRSCVLTYHQVRILKRLHRTITFVYHNSNMEMSDSNLKK